MNGDSWGVVSFADSLDCVGIMARNVNDVKTTFGNISSYHNEAFPISQGSALDTLAQYDPRDPSAAKPETREKASQACSSAMKDWFNPSHIETLQGLRIGIPRVTTTMSIHDLFPNN